MVFLCSFQTWDNWLCGFYRKLRKNSVLANHRYGMSKATNTVKFVNLEIFPFVFILSLLHHSLTSVLLTSLFSFIKSSLVHTSFDRSSRVLFSCAYKHLKLPSSKIFIMNPKPNSLLLQISNCWKKRSSFSTTTLSLRFSIAFLETLCLAR